MRLGQVLFKCVNRGGMSPEQFLNRENRAVAKTQPNEFWRMAEQQTTLLKIGILGDDHKSILIRIIPDGGVGSFRKSNLPHMNASGVQVGKEARKSRRKILVEQQFHPGSIASLRSRSAAKARQARMSSSVRSGNSSSNS